jgi:hypothetical protein
MPSSKSRAIEPDDDVEGHGSPKTRVTGEDEADTEGHMFSNPVLGRELARERERDIQRNLQAHAAKAEASRPHKK